MLVWFAQVAFAGEPALDALLQQLAAKYGSVSVLRGSFVQTTGSVYGDQTQNGTVVLKRPGRMRWEFTGDAQGGGKQFVSDGSTLWIYSPAEKQVIRVANFGAQAESAFAVFQSLDKLGQLYAVKLGENSPASHQLIVTPKPGDEAQFTKLVLTFDAKLDIDELSITDSFATVTRMDFTKLVAGGEARDDVFSFTVPAGVQVVDAGG